MEEKICEHLKTDAESKANWINYYFAERKGDTFILATSPLLKQVLTAGTLGPEIRTHMGDMSWQKYLRGYKKTYDYYDLLLISPEGDVLWSVEAESELCIDQ